MEKPESELTAQELRLKAAGLVQESKGLPQSAIRKWIATTKEATRLYELADALDKPKTDGE